MAVVGEFIHRFAGHAVFIGDELGGVAHAPVLQRTPETIVQQGIGQLQVSESHLTRSSLNEIGSPAHRLEPAGHEQLSIPGFDGACGQHGGFQP